MKDFLSNLTERTAEFGNHYRKQLQAVTKYLTPLIERLEEDKRRELVHIIHPSYDFDASLKIIGASGRNTREKLDFLGTYFALQFLLMNRQVIDHLRMDVIDSDTNRFFIYKKFMRDVGDKFRMLTTCYIKELLNIFVDKEECPEFVILGVGTKADQDDIDVGIIDDGSKDRESFNRAIALIGQEMLKFAISFHFHLSEHIGRQHYSASIDEYKMVLDHEIRDFVIINEMLGGAIIIGSEGVFRKYKKEIIDRYFYHQDGDNRYHEGYLRGILGEISSLLARPLSATHINFKEDALRIIKSILSARKTVFNIEKVNCWDIIDDLKTKDTSMYHEYNALERSLTFFEIFRYIYQLLVTQDEEVILEEIPLKNIRRVAKLLGYADIGKCPAEEHIIVHYYEHIQNIRKTIPVLLEDTKKHLKLHSIFVPLFTSDYHGNIVQDFLRKFTFFRGTSFWDDILDDFKTEEFLKRFIDDLNSFQPDRRKKFIKGYVEWVKYDFYSLIQFLTILGKSKTGFPLFKDLNNHLLKTIDKIPEVERNIAYVFYRFPHLINSYLSLIEEDHLNHYLKILNRRIYEEEIASVVGNLKNLIKIHLASSHFFKNLFLKILDKHPESIRLLQEPQRLKEFAGGLYGDISSMRSFKEMKEKLADYYDFEMLRVGISSLQGAPVQVTNTEYTEFSDRFIHTIFDICRQEVDAEYKKRIITEDLLAVFAAGGHAREQAYDDDYDIIVLLNSDDEEILSYCNKIVSKMNSAIIKRGAVPHHRFADYFGRFVIRLKEIEQLLSESRQDIFIEKSQILGARLLVGSHRFEKEFFETVVKPHIFDKKEEYISQMINEIHSRHTADKEHLLPASNIKESSGGLRDIEMMMLIIKAKFNVREPVNSKLFEIVANAQTNLKHDLKNLSEVLHFLKNLRDVYRLTAGATDTIMIEALHSPARIMGYKSAAELYKKFKEKRKEVEEIIKNLIKKLQS
ncbi:hypothetical protein AMJ52_06555 [candidate division TA06 bacterium DG_78]|uniref:PII-uridylyltransferase/Glutamine-synthetase adenylyltransferase domain-containing protein n=1 Tax=candidate division TA06 bacterium DG_78 TaxID=1703772 RepID=A0A0S7YCR3_UNCT6|nr:MAG: hypothetical protein AMJ52_06555 [candidate division TA06 bacterium DG_78]